MPDYEDISPNFRKALIDKMKTNVPFWALIGMEVVDVKKGWAKIRLPFSEKLTQPDGIAHGGSVFSTADAAVTVALLGLIDRDETLATIEMKINFLRPFDKGEILAEAKIIYRGGKTAVGDVEVTNSQGELIAKCLATFMIIRRNPGI